ncbi:MAG: T9SS type A sorting domain-containing protein [Hymenobacter sp.]|nr:MAG: T9SS type A sorting domain-containing protein [Hymenobacter sp.]
MKKYTTHSCKLLFFGLLAIGTRLAHAQTYKTVTLTNASFTADIIANGTAANAPTSSTTADMDGAGYYYISQDYYTATTAHTSGLPNSGTISNSIAGPAALTYQLASFGSNNSLRLTGTSSGTLTFATPTIATEIYVLGATGSGSATATLTVNYADGTSSAFTGQSYPDWFTTSATQNVFGASARASSGTPISATTANNTAPFLDQVKLAVPTAKQGTQITSIGVTKTSTAGVLNLMAVSITNPTPLPVRLVGFSAQRSRTAVGLSWVTATEVANTGFAVERSDDGIEWTSLNFIAGVGNSAQSQTYAYTDVEAPATTTYYRLRQINTDGSTSYSPVQIVPEKADASLTLYPNPSTGELIQVLGASSAVPLRLLDAQGRLVRELPVNTLSIDPKGLPAGLYLVRTGGVTQRLVIQ